MLLVIALAASAARADIAAEETGRSERLPTIWGPRWFWASDLLLRRSALFDAESGQMLGVVDAGQDLSPVAPLRSIERPELYVASTYYSRRSHGERSDALVIYDTRTLGPIGEVALPAKKASNAHGIGIVTLLDDGRFALVFNQTPANSVSVVDVVERRFAGEIETGGCALVYPAGPRRFGMLCVDGSALTITLDERGAEASRTASQKFFDAAKDPVTEKGVRLGVNGGRWLFASFGGLAHVVDFAARGGPVAEEPWSLFSDEERADGWRIGGHQHLAFQAREERLYSLVHRGETDTHKEAGTELWVYGLQVGHRGTRKVREIELPNLSASALRGLLDLPAGGALDWLLQRLVPNAGADCVLVTTDTEPLIVLSNQQAPVIAVLDGTSGELLREIEEPGIAIGLLVAP
jgi:methylamine dehydrogenase heavy chain